MRDEPSYLHGWYRRDGYDTSRCGPFNSLGRNAEFVCELTQVEEDRHDDAASRTPDPKNSLERPVADAAGEPTCRMSRVDSIRDLSSSFVTQVLQSANSKLGSDF